jgi:hypothetical protein
MSTTTEPCIRTLEQPEVEAILGRNSVGRMAFEQEASGRECSIPAANEETSDERA